MLSVNRLPNKKTGAAASLLLLALSLGFLFVQHFTVAAEVGEARAPESFAPAAHEFEKLTSDIARAELAAAKHAEGTGPGGQQPWVRWSYIP